VGAVSRRSNLAGERLGNHAARGVPGGCSEGLTSKSQWICNTLAASATDRTSRLDLLTALVSISTRTDSGITSGSSETIGSFLSLTARRYGLLFSCLAYPGGRFKHLPDRVHIIRGHLHDWNS
jgi:hypothetical protein